MNGVTNALLSQDKYQWNWIRSEDATYKLLDEKTPLSFTGDLYCSLLINRVDYVGNNKPNSGFIESGILLYMKNHSLIKKELKKSGLNPRKMS